MGFVVTSTILGWSAAHLISVHPYADHHFSVILKRTALIHIISALALACFSSLQFTLCILAAQLTAAYGLQRLTLYLLSSVPKSDRSAHLPALAAELRALGEGAPFNVLLGSVVTKKQPTPLRALAHIAHLTYLHVFTSSRGTPQLDEERALARIRSTLLTEMEQMEKRLPLLLSDQSVSADEGELLFWLQEVLSILNTQIYSALGDDGGTLENRLRKHYENVYANRHLALFRIQLARPVPIDALLEPKKNLGTLRDWMEAYNNSPLTANHMLALLVCLKPNLKDYRLWLAYLIDCARMRPDKGPKTEIPCLKDLPIDGTLSFTSDAAGESYRAMWARTMGPSVSIEGNQIKLSSPKSPLFGSILENGFSLPPPNPNDNGAPLILSKLLEKDMLPDWNSDHFVEFQGRWVLINPFWSAKEVRYARGAHRTDLKHVDPIAYWLLKEAYKKPYSLGSQWMLYFFQTRLSALCTSPRNKKFLKPGWKETNERYVQLFTDPSGELWAAPDNEERGHGKKWASQKQAVIQAFMKATKKNKPEACKQLGKLLAEDWKNPHSPLRALTLMYDMPSEWILMIALRRAGVETRP